MTEHESYPQDTLSIERQHRIDAITFSRKTWKRREKSQITMLQICFPIMGSLFLLIVSLLIWGVSGLILTGIILFIITILLQPTIRIKLKRLFINTKTHSFKRLRPLEGTWLFFDNGERCAMFYDGHSTVRGIVLFKLIPSTRIKENLFGFYRSCYRQGIPVFWSHYVIPKNGNDIRNNLRIDQRVEFESMPLAQLERKIEDVGGIWEMIILVGTQVVQTITTSLQDTLESVKNKVLEKQALLDGKLIGAFPHAKVVSMKSNELIEGVQYLSLGGNLPSFYTSTAEVVAYKFIHVPTFAITKSMKSHPPAEFTVPTHLPFDLPIGYSIETETMNIEHVVGLQVSDLFSNIVIMGGNSSERFHVISRILRDTCEKDFCTILLTTSHKYRNLLDIIPTLRIIRLGTDSALKIFQSGISQNGEYLTLLTEFIAAMFNLSSSGSQHLERILFDFQEMGEESLTAFFEYLDTILSDMERQLHYSDRDSYKAIKWLFNNLNVGKGVQVFGGPQIPMYKLIKQPIIIEIPFDGEIKKRFTTYLLLIKILSSIQNLNYRGGLVFIEDARVLQEISSANRFGNEQLNNCLEKIIRQFNENGFGFLFDVPRPSVLKESLLGLFSTFISYKLGAGEVKHVAKFLQLKGFQESKMTPRRLYSYQHDWLINLEHNSCLMKMPMHPECFPVVTPLVKGLSEINTWTDEEIDIFLSDDEDVLEFHQLGERPKQGTSMLKTLFPSQRELEIVFLILLKIQQNQDLNIDSISIADQLYYDLLDTGRIEEHERSILSRNIKALVIKLNNFHFLKGEQVPAGNHTVMKYSITQKGIEAIEEHQNYLRRVEML
ncbi:MAG: hypothetical protein ACTSVY_03410 [Candidatus Helarchaeota archaeon]